jgi:ABC-type uncharacterized transport system involved in gliding motility auxiliary subunit
MKTNNVSYKWALVALILVFFVAVTFNNILFNKARVDLTEGNLYSISEGTYQVLQQIEEPINVYFFFSNKSSEGLSTLRGYASRIQSLLEEYELYSNGNIKLSVIDPEPFSEAEDRAAEFGLSAAPINNNGDSLYLGLAATNSIGQKEVIPFFDPSQEKQLEYNISKLIHKLAVPQKRSVAVLSSLPVFGGPNTNPMAMQMGQQPTLPAWAAFEQLQQLYDVNILEQDAETIPESSNLLVLVHPKDLNDSQLYAIDQFVMRGGKLMVFVDPLAESDVSSAGMMGMPMASSSDLARLFETWGVEFDNSKVVIDAAQGLEIRMPNGMPGRHAGYIGFQGESIDNDDIIVSSLSSINSASVGELGLKDSSALKMQSLLLSSDQSSKVEVARYQMAGNDPSSLLDDFTDSLEKKVVAARFFGSIPSAFSELPETADAEAHIENTDDAQIMIVADTDMLTDNFWVQKANFFGQTILQPFANNGDFLINSVDNFSGSTALMSIRGKGQFQRPFDVVDELTVIAEEKFRAQEQRLQQELEQTEQQLMQLQNQQGDNTSLTLSPEQEQAIAEFVNRKVEIRKELREVRHQLDKDIESLGTWIKLINIGVMPLLLTGLLFLVFRRKRNRLVI